MRTNFGLGMNILNSYNILVSRAETMLLHMNNEQVRAYSCLHNEDHGPLKKCQSILEKIGLT